MVRSVRFEPLATFISFIALIFSGISLYETILKRAEPVLHIGSVIHCARDYTQPDDVFVLPVTVTNTGAREAVIVEFQLLVAQAGEGNTAWTSFTSLYSGTNPRTDKQFFSPISIAGRGTSKKRTAFLPGPIA